MRDRRVFVAAEGTCLGAVYWGKKGSTICVQTTDILDRIPRVWVMR